MKTIATIAYTAELSTRMAAADVYGLEYSLFRPNVFVRLLRWSNKGVAMVSVIVTLHAAAKAK